MSIEILLDPTCDYKEEGFDSKSDLITALQKIVDSKPQETAPYSKNIPVSFYGEKGKRHTSVRRISFSGKSELVVISGHEVDSYWQEQVTEDRFIGPSPDTAVAHSEWAAYRNKAA